MQGYKYRGRPISGAVMKYLIVELSRGENNVLKGTFPRGKIIQICNDEHVQRGGTNTPKLSLASSFKKACNDLRLVGAIEDAGYGHWHVIGWHYSEDIEDEIAKKRPSIKASSSTDMKHIKHVLYGEQKGRCPRCSKSKQFEDFSIDHIIPKSKGGGDKRENLQLLCHSCNSSKGNRT